MNIPILVAGILSLLAFFVHAFVGDMENRVLKPVEDALEIKTAWVQVRCGWHWVSVDLIMSSCLLILLATTEIIKAKSEILLLLSLYYLLCGIVWFGTVYFSKSDNKQILALGQWIFCFLMSGLICAGI